MKIKIPNLTLTAVDCTNRINGTISALVEGSKNIDFGAVMLISHEKPDNLPDFIQFKECKKINNIDDFNYFMFLELGDYIQTSHCLYIQDHARILDYALWNDDWLQYDYGGAPWRIVENAYMANDGTRSRVGNGGFSLRSKLIMDAPKKLGLELKQEQSFFNEDGNLCCYHRKELNKYGMKYMPLEQAIHFSFETPMQENYLVKSFGYHRNLPPWGKYE